MKFLFYTALAILLSWSSAHSQVFLGGTGNVSFQSVDNNNPNGSVKTKSLILNPRIGFFLSDNVVAGLELGYENHDYAGYGDYHLLSAGLFSRYFFKNHERIRFFGDLSATYGIGQELRTGDKAFDIQEFRAQLQPGVSFALTPKVHLQLTVGNLQYGVSTPNGYSNSTKSFSVSLNRIGAGIWFAL